MVVTYVGRVPAAVHRKAPPCRVASCPRGSFASNPFGHEGVNYLGTVTHLPDYTVLSTGVVSSVRAGAIVAGHVLGTVAAHDRVLRLLPQQRATRAELPLLILMVVFTMGGLLLILA